MFKFERFIIYPVLFIALFFSIADDGVQQTTAQEVIDQLIVKDIRVVNDKGEAQIHIDGASPTPSISIKSSTFHPDSYNYINNYGMSIYSKYHINVLNSSEMKISNNSEEYSILNDGIITLGVDYTGGNGGGALKLLNEKEDKRITLSTDSFGHGLITVYDKYGEDFRIYSYK